MSETPTETSNKDFEVDYAVLDRVFKRNLPYDPHRMQKLRVSLFKRRPLTLIPTLLLFLFGGIIPGCLGLAYTMWCFDRWPSAVACITLGFFLEAFLVFVPMPLYTTIGPFELREMVATMARIMAFLWLQSWLGDLYTYHIRSGGRLLETRVGVAVLLLFHFYVNPSVYDFQHPHNISWHKTDLKRRSGDLDHNDWKQSPDHMAANLVALRYYVKSDIPDDRAAAREFLAGPRHQWLKSKLNDAGDQIVELLKLQLKGSK